MRFPPLLPLLFTCATKLTKSQNLYFYTSSNASVCTFLLCYSPAPRPAHALAAALLMYAAISY